MGTKVNPAPHDCYAKAEPDEPMFVLIARDPQAPQLIRQWADRRDQQFYQRNPSAAEVNACADAMDEWRQAHRPAPKP